MLIADTVNWIICCDAAPQKTSRHEGEVLRNLKKRDSTDSMCCLLRLHVSLPHCLRLWHCPLPLRLFLGGARPDALSPPGSKALGHPHHLPAISLHNIWKKDIESHYSHHISILFQWCLRRLKVCLSLELSRQIFSSQKKQTAKSLAPSHAIYPISAFGLT